VTDSETPAEPSPPADSPHDDSPLDDSPLDDMWERLRRLEDLERPAPDAPGVDRTRVMNAANPAPAPTEAAAKQYFVPAPAPAAPTAAAAPAPRPAARARAESEYRAAAAPPSAPVTNRARPPQTPAPTPTEPASRRRRTRRKWYRPKLRWLFLYLPLLVIALIGGLLFWGWSTVNGLYRVDLGNAIAPATGDATNYLIVGSDTREGIDGSTPNVGAIGTGTEVTGRRSDTIIVLRVDGASAKMMSVPRDLWVTNVATGKKGRINGSYAQGPDNLARTVTANLGIPINRYVEVDFVSFAGMVDAMGGIEIDFPHPVIDPNSGLKIATAGRQKLDGSMALAYVRSRHYTEEIDGKPVLEPTADIGRQARQQNFIRTVLRTAGDTRNPITLARVGAAAAKGVRVDTEVGFFDLVSLARQLGGADPESKVLPTVGANKGGASVLELKNAEALPVLAEFGAGG